MYKSILKISDHTSEELIKSVFEDTNTALAVVDDDTTLLKVNSVFEKLSGYSKKDIEGKLSWTQFVQPGERNKMLQFHKSRRIDPKKAPRSYIFKFIDRKNRVKDIFINVYMIPGTKKSFASIIDVTEKIKAEAKLIGSEKKYRSLFENSIDGIYRTTLDGKYLEINKSLVKLLGYDKKSELMSLDVPKYVYVNGSKRPGPNERKRSFETRLRKKDGKRIDVEISSRVINKNNKPVGYVGIVRDITEKKKNYKKIQKTLDNTLNTLSSIVEMRDRYTAGHQKRVSMLAFFIAKKLGLKEKNIESTRIAALIHDIGKISISQSLLSRPGKLLDIEFNLVKNHTNISHEIAKQIRFDLPIKKIILQHHERLDGSGYPKGLKGKDITIEARIIAVADVVEAMTSHRPYRPALSLEAAIDEINKNKDILYDSKVTDACIDLISDKKFFSRLREVN